MQERQDRHDYPTVDDPSCPSTAQSGKSSGTADSALEPYVPPNVPHGLPHVVRYATLSSMDLPLEVRFLIIMIRPVRGRARGGVSGQLHPGRNLPDRVPSHGRALDQASLRHRDTAEGTREGRQGPEDQQLHVPGRGQELAATASGPPRHQPHRPTFQQTPIPSRPTAPRRP